MHSRTSASLHRRPGPETSNGLSRLGALASTLKRNSQEAHELLARSAQLYGACETYRDSGTVECSDSGGLIVRVDFRTAFSRNPARFRFAYRTDNARSGLSSYEEILALADARFRGAMAFGAVETIGGLLDPELGSLSTLNIREPRSIPSQQGLNHITGLHGGSGAEIEVWLDEEACIRAVTWHQDRILSVFRCMPEVDVPIDWNSLASPSRIGAAIRDRDPASAEQFGKAMSQLLEDLVKATGSVGISTDPSGRDELTGLRAKIHVLLKLQDGISKVAGLPAALARLDQTLEAELAEPRTRFTDQLRTEMQNCLDVAGLGNRNKGPGPS